MILHVERGTPILKTLNGDMYRSIQRRRSSTPAMYPSILLAWIWLLLSTTHAFPLPVRSADYSSRPTSAQFDGDPGILFKRGPGDNNAEGSTRSEPSSSSATSTPPLASAYPSLQWQNPYQYQAPRPPPQTRPRTETSTTPRAVNIASEVMDVKSPSIFYKPTGRLGTVLNPNAIGAKEKRKPGAPPKPAQFLTKNAHFPGTPKSSGNPVFVPPQNPKPPLAGPARSIATWRDNVGGNF